MTYFSCGEIIADRSRTGDPTEQTATHTLSSPMHFDCTWTIFDYI